MAVLKRLGLSGWIVIGLLAGVLVGTVAPDSLYH